MFSVREFHYRWEFDLHSSPEQLWPMIADTNRFNRDTGVPAVEAIGDADKNARRRLRLTSFGIPIEWEEQPFEWVRPQRFGVVRRYSKGPVEELRVLAQLAPVAEAETEEHGPRTGTKLVYEVGPKPKNILGLIAIPVQIGIISARNFARTFRHYDAIVRDNQRPSASASDVEFAPGGRARLIGLDEKLMAEGTNEELVALLIDFIENAEDRKSVV